MKIKIKKTDKGCEITISSIRWKQRNKLKELFHDTFHKKIKVIKYSDDDNELMGKTIIHFLSD